MSTAIVFPGQGSQYVGMGTDFIDRDTRWFKEICEQVHFPLEEYLRNGPPDILSRTDITQPAVFIVNHLIFRFITDSEVTASCFGGHSLGEYNALVASGRCSFGELLPVVIERGQAMHEAVSGVDGEMAAVLKIETAELESLCKSIRDDDSVDGSVEVALMNSPGQTVISGARTAVNRAVELAKENGALKTVKLDVSGPWHSQYMSPACERLRSKLKKISWKDGASVLTNVNADYLGDDSPRESLIQQLQHPVRWQESIEKMIEDGVDTFVEVGPGDALTGMIQRISRGYDIDINIYTTDTIDRTRTVVEELGHG